MAYNKEYIFADENGNPQNQNLYIYIHYHASCLHCHYDDMIMYVKFYQHHLTAVKSQTSHVHSGIARPRPTRACALPSSFQALPSSAQQESHDSVTNYTRKQMHYLSCSAI